nr:NADH-quinone oxidoreductase subunit A [Actinomycetota bacterium]
PYECGIVPDEKTAERFPVRFYLVAMIFIIFDIEIIFLYPWVVILRRLGPFGLWEMLVFAGALFVSFVYLLGRGALNWGPTKQSMPEHEVAEGIRADERSSETTIRRVGGDGRVPVRVRAGAGADRNTS